FHLLLHPLVTLGVERRGFARMAIFAAAGEGDLEIIGDIARGSLRVGHHRRVQEGLHNASRVTGFFHRRDSTGAGIWHGRVSVMMNRGSLCTIRTSKSMRYWKLSYTVLHTIMANDIRHCLLDERSASTNQGFSRRFSGYGLARGLPV